MYQYDEFDRRVVRSRAAQYRRQVARWQAGELADDEFRPLRLQNGLYIQRHAPMLRIAIPYGHLSSVQLRKLAYITRHHDRGVGHFTTRQNLQLNWVKIEETPDILDHLADVDMHAIQTSGNCVRNITTDAYAGVAPDEIVDPRPFCELVRQWSTLHPEFAYLPRKFKIAVSGATEDRALLRFHDVALELHRDANGEPLVRFIVGGGMGRTPILGETVRDDVPWRDMHTYLEAILRVYNRFGRRDNMYKARIKILVKSLGVAAFREQVEEEFSRIANGPNRLPEDALSWIQSRFVTPQYETLTNNPAVLSDALASNIPFARWHKRNVRGHKAVGYAAVTLSTKRAGFAPGDVTDAQMDAVADLADQYSLGELRITHDQNIVLAHVKQSDLPALHSALHALGFATPSIGLVSDMIACPGGDFCDLANARSIPIAAAVAERLEDLDEQEDIGPLRLNISGCMNSCGQHHAGHIGILGVDKQGQEWYQLSVGGSGGTQSSIGAVLGPSLRADQVPDAVEQIIEVYLEARASNERFLDTVRRIGAEPFKNKLYPNKGKSAADNKVAQNG